MNAHVTEEQQVAELKQWFKDNGSSLLLVGAVLIAGVSGWRYYQNTQESNAQQAATVYFQMMQSIETAPQLADAQARTLIDQYPKTPYRDLAVLSLAKLAAEEKRFDEAQLHLQWVIDNARQKGMVELARLRLAYVLMAKDEWPAALALVEQPPNDGFKLVYLETVGDIHTRLKQRDQAITAYQRVLQSEMAPMVRQRIERKLEYLGIATKPEGEALIPEIDLTDALK